MHNVVHVSVAGAVWWQKTAKGWQTMDAPDTNTKAPVWVVTDLAEENFSEIKVPRVFGADRAGYIRRQLANRFPDSVFRIALPPPQAGGLMDRLAPPRQTLTAIEPADRVELALAHIKAPVAGVWSTSMLMARIGQRAAMPAHLFVVLFQPGGMRILFIKQRVPVLTRLITATQSELEQAAEIIRTVRHLENTHVMDRNKERYGVLLMGGSASVKAKLSEDRLNILPLPNRWSVNEEGASWNKVIFDQAINKPPGQLAPLKFRISFVASEIKKYARLISIFVALSAFGLVGVNAFKALQAERLGIELKKQIKTVESKISKADTDISAYGVSPDMVRKALTLDTEEVENAPDLEQHMIRLSEIISVIPEMRVKRWQWRVLEPAEAACTKDLTSASSATAVAESVDQIYPNQTSVRKVELQMTVAFAEGIGPRLLVKQTEEISNKFRKWSGALVIRDPALSLRKTDVSIPSLIRPNVVNETGWCVSVPAKIMVQP